MTPEELDEARAKEAERICDIENSQSWTLQELATIAARLARENWTPPEPVDPDVLAFREFAVRTGLGHLPSSAMAGKLDNGRVAKAYLAGARMAREQERERAKVLVDRLSDLVERVTDDGKQDSVTGVNASEMISARVALAKYRGEA